MGLSIPFVLALVLASTGFFFKVPTTEALQCYKCVSDSGVPGGSDNCKNPTPADTELIMDCEKDNYIQNLTTNYEDIVVVCTTTAGMKNGEMVIERSCSVDGMGELRACLDKMKFPTTSGCATGTLQEYLSWFAGLGFCVKRKSKPVPPAEPGPGDPTEPTVGGRNGGDQQLKLEGKLAYCPCTGDLCNSITAKDLPDISGTSSTRGSKGVIFSITLLIHLQAASALWH